MLSLLNESFVDEWEIQYYEKCSNWHVLKENDYDSRLEEDFRKVNVSFDKRNHATFKRF